MSQYGTKSNASAAGYAAFSDTAAFIPRERIYLSVSISSSFGITSWWIVIEAAPAS